MPARLAPPPTDPAAVQLLRRRTALAISQPQLAAWSGVRVRSLMRFELGRTHLSDLDLAKLDIVLTAIEQARSRAASALLAAS